MSDVFKIRLVRCKWILGSSFVLHWRSDLLDRMHYVMRWRNSGHLCKQHSHNKSLQYNALSRLAVLFCMTHWKLAKTPQKYITKNEQSNVSFGHASSYCWSYWGKEKGIVQQIWSEKLRTKGHVLYKLIKRIPRRTSRVLGKLSFLHFEVCFRCAWFT